MPVLNLLARCLAAIALLAATACSTYLDQRAEAALREALARVVGPAESYDVRVSGASLDGSRFERVRFVGRRTARANAPVIDRLELDLQGVVVDRSEKRLTAVAATRAELHLRGGDLAEYLRKSAWIADPSVVFSAPDRVAIAGAPRLGGIALEIGTGAEFQGRLFASGSQLRLAVDRVRIGSADAAPFLRAVIERAINPLVDVAAYPLPARIDAVEAGDGELRIAASGSRLPTTAP
ncbi:MAG: LmeA family phospholipid-binding protein [Caldimonas sp.]